jgi:hypothetical protein
LISIGISAKVEVEVSSSLPNADGTLPAALYIGVAPLQPEVGYYEGAGYAVDVVGGIISAIEMIRGQR